MIVRKRGKDLFKRNNWEELSCSMAGRRQEFHGGYSLQVNSPVPTD